MENLNVTIIGAGKLAKVFYEEFRNEFEFNLVGTDWQQFEKFDHLSTKNAFVIDNLSSDSLVSALQSTDVVVCMLAPSRERIIDQFRKGISLCQIYKTVYIDFAYRLVEVLSSFPRIDHLVWCSSVGVYGNHKAEPVDESSTTNLKQSDANYCLLEAEHIINVLKYQDIQVSILRFGKLYSKTRSLREVYDIAKSCLNINSQLNRVNCVHELDAVNAIAYCINNGNYGIYNVTNELNQLPYYQLIYKISNHFGLPKIWVAGSGEILPTNCQAVSDAILETGFEFSHKTTIE